MRYKTIIYLVLSVCLFCINSCKTGLNANNEKFKEIEKLESDIPIFPKMIEVSSHSTSKSNVASKSKYYKSNADFDDVKSFFKEKLAHQEWEFVEENPVTDWGRNFNGRELIFRKGEHTFSIQFAGDKSDYEWNYATTLKWERSVQN